MIFRSNRPQGGDVNQGAAVRPCGACRESDMALRRTPVRYSFFFFFPKTSLGKYHGNF